MTLQRLALCAMLLKLLVPFGFMPGNLWAGEWLTLCPQGLPAAMFEHAHHQHVADVDPGDDGSPAQSGNMCPVGFGFGMAGMPSQLAATFNIATMHASWPLLQLDFALVVSNQRARAPPV